LPHPVGTNVHLCVISFSAALGSPPHLHSFPTRRSSDLSLRNLLKAHLNCLGRDELTPEIPPEAVEDLTRIPDLCLFQQICPSYEDRKSTRLNSSHVSTSYAVFCLKKIIDAAEAHVAPEA